MSKPRAPGDRHAGAGLSLASPAATPDDVPVQKSQQSVASRAVALSSYFLSGALCINLSQFLGTPLYLINQDWYNAWIAFTKQSFGLLTMTLTQTFSPTKVIVSGDESVRGQLLRQTDGTLLLDFPERLVLIANHQIYTDWLYLWWTAYCSGMHGRLYIILKESLKKIPILGWGMQFNQFIFLKRNWEQDRSHMAQALQRLNKLTDPMWLLLFPEGTNLAPSTRQKSAQWATKNNMKDMRHCLLPRSTGLRFCLQELKGTVDYLYDCTIAYEGVPRGAFAQDIFTLKTGYLEGRPPKSVSMYWRRFAIKDIPLNNEKAFELWLLARWREKDLLIENYLIHGRFPADTGVSRTPSGTVKRGAGHLNVEIKSSHWYEFLQIFAPMGILAMVLYIFYGALPQKFFKSESGKALKDSASDIKTLSSSVKTPSMPESFSLDMIFDKDKQAQTFGKAGKAMAQFVQSPEAQSMMNRADLVQRWLQDPQKLLLESMTTPTQKENFMQSLEEEANRRKRMANKHQGTFWDDLENAESRATPSVAGKPKTGTFYNDMQKARAQKKVSALTEGNLKKKANFWDDLDKETNRRAGSVLTLPTLSTESSRTAINSLNSGSTAIGSGAATSKAPKLPKQGPKKLPTTSANKASGTTKPSPAVKKPATTSTVGNGAPKVKQPPPKAQPTSAKKPASTTAQPKASTTSNVKKPVSKPAAPKTSTTAPTKKAVAKPTVAKTSTTAPVKKPPKLESNAPATSKKPVVSAK
ncbi:hypothetical protein OHC33_000313 [Knufia fluminis]|uniref:Phospholipid/glycerol acyltransferase domain-containing protein n=1 Tax=Knufia fluminis TaxID=191047 RepID=A0AAN8EXL8_9EURO|nr:hypothetical protein OHC33_000313 [Knufia fluminis]